MNRPIEIRLWDEKEKKMFYEATITTVKSDEKYSGKESVNKIFETLHSAYKVMQYTGLKDMNEKKVYDGDIVTYHGIPEEQLTPTFIEVHKKLHKGGVPFIVKILETLTVDLMSFDEQHHNDISFFDWSKIEVIGNIYEDARLIRYTL